MAEPKGKDINTRMILTIGIVSAILVLGVIIPGLQAMLAAVTNRFTERTVVEQAHNELVTHRLEERSKINDYRYIDRENDVVAIPIERAMDLYAQRMAENSDR